jgi:hypothetical protein
VASETVGATFVVFVYEGSGEPHTSWSVDSLLISDADLPDVLAWLRGSLPEGCCWSLGLARPAADPDADPSLRVEWVVGADLLNTDPARLAPEEQRLVDDMLRRRHRVDLA